MSANRWRLWVDADRAVSPRPAMIDAPNGRGRGQLSGYLTGVAIDAKGRLELLNPIGMQPASNSTSKMQNSLFNCVPKRWS
jgi:hypothetical protein